MYAYVKSTLVFFAVMYIFMHHCLNIIPERAKLTYVNDKFFENVTLNVRRYGRRSNYVVNFEVTSKVELGNNVTVDIIFYEYLHNEYRRSFVETHFKYCDLVLKDPYFGIIIRRAGVVTCPLPPKRYSFTNTSLDIEIPSVFPFEKGMVELIVTSDSEKAVMGKLEVVLTFKQKLQKL